MLNPVLFRQYESSDMNKISHFSRFCLILRSEGWNRKWKALRRAAGYRGNKWVPDVCRHTFASYHAAFFRNLPELQLEMGHRDASLLMTRYMAPALKKDAAAFWKGAGVLME